MRDRGERERGKEEERGWWKERGRGWREDGGRYCRGEERERER